MKEPGEAEVEQARLDNRAEGGPPEDPLTYGDVAVGHPEASAWIEAANTDGATAASAARGKHSRYLAWALPGGRLVALPFETFGRWAAEALAWLRAAAHAARARPPPPACLRAPGPPAPLAPWPARPAVAPHTPCL